MKRYIIALLIMASATAAAARTVYSLNDNWQFFYKLATYPCPTRGTSTLWPGRDTISKPRPTIRATYTFRPSGRASACS